jgi:chemotaxis protein methyltransferase CheR
MAGATRATASAAEQPRPRPEPVRPDALRLGKAEFERLADFVTAATGIRMPAGKRTMLESRLRRRVLAMGLDSFAAYCDHVLSGRAAEAERVELIDAVTTNKTDFFREPHHFEHLARQALPALVAATGAGTRRPLRVWSAACSTGEEPYTLAMVLAEEATRRDGFAWAVLGTDVSSRVLRVARDAVYREDQVAPVPAALRTRYLMRSRDAARGIVRVVPELREQVSFAWLNFMDADWAVGQPFHAIFCRNVLIYFDAPTQATIVRRLLEHLLPGGFLYLGHSETVNGMAVPVTTVAPTVYRKTG